MAVLSAVGGLKEASPVFTEGIILMTKIKQLNIISWLLIIDIELLVIWLSEA